MKGGVVIAVMVALAMVVVMVEPGQATVDCGQVAAALSPCMPYLTKGGSPPNECCNGVRNLKNMTPTTPDRQAACNCVKEAAGHYKNIRADAASQLPGKCGVQTNVPISKDVDCSKIN